MTLDSWAMFTGDGNELCRGLQLPDDKARAAAQRRATELNTIIELVSEDEMRAASAEDREADGEIFEP